MAEYNYNEILSKLCKFPLTPGQKHGKFSLGPKTQDFLGVFCSVVNEKIYLNEKNKIIIKPGKAIFQLSDVFRRFRNVLKFRPEERNDGKIFKLKIPKQKKTVSVHVRVRTCVCVSLLSYTSCV